MLRIGARRRKPDDFAPERRRVGIVGPLIAAYAAFAVAVTLVSLVVR